MKISGEKLIDLTRERKYPLEKLLSFEIVDNHFLFDPQDFLTKPVKSLLTLELEKYLTQNIGEYFPTNAKNCCIVDSMSYIRKLTIPTMEDKTFRGFCKCFFNMLDNVVPKNASRMDLVFDSYVDDSPKAYERLRRSSAAAIELNTIEDDVPIPK